MNGTVGCICDDLTGATDIAATLAARGLRTQLLVGPPPWPAAGETDAFVVALKTRTTSRERAIDESVSSLAGLAELGVSKFIYKYCSTFDSTPAGNIGPVSEALRYALGQPVVTYCPAFPANGRTVVDGHLLVDGVPLDQTSMRTHPLTPMLSSDLVELLAPQVREAVGAIQLEIVRSGPAAVRQRLDDLSDRGVRHVVVDATLDDDLVTVGAATDHLRLATGSSAVALGYPALTTHAGLERDDWWPSTAGPTLVIAGSCSTATLRQIDDFAQDHPAYRIDVGALLSGGHEATKVVAWAHEQRGAPIIVYSSAPITERGVSPDATQVDDATVIEQCLAEVAARIVVECGITRLIVAGGETSGAVAARLGIAVVTIGPPIATGIPWTLWSGSREIAVAFKSGNFGPDDFFRRALQMLS